MNQICKVCGEPAAGFHFGAFTCEGCKSFFGRSYNNLSSISECKNNGKCVIDKKNRTNCKACRLRKCYNVGMSKGGSRYGRRSNWFKIHCLLQEQQQQALEAVVRNGSLPGLMTNSAPPNVYSTLDNGMTAKAAAAVVATNPHHHFSPSASQVTATSTTPEQQVQTMSAPITHSGPAPPLRAYLGLLPEMSPVTLMSAAALPLFNMSLSLMGQTAGVPNSHYQMPLPPPPPPPQASTLPSNTQPPTMAPAFFFPGYQLSMGMNPNNGYHPDFYKRHQSGPLMNSAASGLPLPHLPPTSSHQPINMFNSVRNDQWLPAEERSKSSPRSQSVSSVGSVGCEENPMITTISEESSEVNRNSPTVLSSHSNGSSDSMALNRIPSQAASYSSPFEQINKSTTGSSDFSPVLPHNAHNSAVNPVSPITCAAEPLEKEQYLSRPPSNGNNSNIQLHQDSPMDLSLKTTKKSASNDGGDVCSEISEESERGLRRKFYQLNTETETETESSSTSNNSEHSENSQISLNSSDSENIKRLKYGETDLDAQPYANHSSQNALRGIFVCV